MQGFYNQFYKEFTQYYYEDSSLQTTKYWLDLMNQEALTNNQIFHEDQEYSRSLKMLFMKMSQNKTFRFQKF